MNHQEIRTYVIEKYAEIRKGLVALARSEGYESEDIGRSIAYGCFYLHTISGKRPSQNARKNELLRRDGSMCQGCGGLFYKSQLTIDHVRPKSDGGSDYLDNLVLLCEPCNRLKGSYFTLSGLRAMKTGHLVVSRNKTPDSKSWSPK